MRFLISGILFLMATWVGCAPPEEPETATNLPPACPTFVDASGGLPEFGEWRTRPSIADVNGDGLADLAILGRKVEGPRVYLSDGLGGWILSSEGLDYGGGISCGVGTRLVDLNQDRNIDLLVADHCEGVRVFLGDGGTSWVDSSKGIPRNLQGFNDAAVGDINGDGHLDIVAISAFSRGFMVLHGRGDGTWNFVRDPGLPAVGSGWQVALVDVNLDGKLDVASTFNAVTNDRRQDPPPPAKIWLQSDNGQFRPTLGFPGEGRFFSVAVTHPRDQLPPDLLFGLGGASYGLYHYTSDDAETWHSLGRIDQAWFGDRIVGLSEVHLSDMNADGCLDILTVENASRRVWLAMGDCQKHWTICPEGTLPMADPMSQGWGVSTGDLNGDGLMDLAAAYGTRGRGRILAWYQTVEAAATN